MVPSTNFEAMASSPAPQSQQAAPQAKSSRSKRVNVVRANAACVFIDLFFFMAVHVVSAPCPLARDAHTRAAAALCGPQEVPEMVTEMPADGKTGQSTMWLRGRLLGKGGFAAVYELQNMSDGRVVAGKVRGREAPICLPVRYAPLMALVCEP